MITNLTIATLSILLLLSYSCKKNTSELKSNNLSISGNNSEESDFRSYSELIPSLVQSGYAEIEIPTNYEPDINIEEYENVTFDLFYNSNLNHYIEVYKFPNETAATAAAEEKECTYKSKALPDGRQDCIDAGKDCKVKVTNDTYVIICCN
ncbi:MAG: hypothetical protein Q8M15_01310 [Bacteroidota bacterium]|nr:hypothetical protein [Bacteroidota bacterium]